MKKRSPKTFKKTMLNNSEKEQSQRTVPRTEMKNPRPAWVLSFKSGVGRDRTLTLFSSDFFA
jgi:hypothetical protein